MSCTSYYFNLPGITCINCVTGIDIALREPQAHKIESFSVDVCSKTIAIVVEDSLVPKSRVISDLQAIMDDVGVDSEHIVELDGEQSAPVPRALGRWGKLRRFFLSHAFQGALGLVLGLALLVLSMAVPGLPLGVMIALGVISVILTLILGAQSYYQAMLKLIKARTLTMDALFAISTLTVIAVSIAAFFVPWMPMMLEAGLLIFGFRHIGLAVEESVKRKMTLDKKFQHLLPRTVRVCLPDDEEDLRALHLVVPDDVLRIAPGELIPVDGECLTDAACLYDTIKTGSTQARSTRAGERLISGMRLHENSSPVYLKASTSAAFSHLARLDQGIVLANREKAPIQEATTRILQYFIPAVIALAIISGIVIGLFFPPALAIQCAVAVLVSACPCTLGLVVPLAVKIGMQKAAEHGVQFKSAKELQSADSIDVVVFDLNGTLTEGMPVVSGFYPVRADDVHDLLAYAAAMEQDSDHPVAKAVRAYARSQQIEPVSTGSDWLPDQSNHSGLHAEINQDVWAIGNANMMMAHGVNELPDNLLLEAGESVIYMARNRVLLGYFVLGDPLRQEARHTVRTLTRLGKEVHICTGADQSTANRYAELLGIPATRIAAACVGLAEEEADRDKRTYIQGLKARGLRVSMVGDAENDSLALAECDFGIAVKSSSGSAITQQQAGAVIQSGSLLPVANAFAVAKQTVSNIKQNLLFSLGYNTMAILLAGGLLVAIGFTLNPGIGVALMVLQTAFILWNAYRFKKQALTHLNEPDHAGQETGVESSYHGICQSMKPGNEPGYDCDSGEEAQYGSLFPAPECVNSCQSTPSCLVRISPGV